MPKHSATTNQWKTHFIFQAQSYLEPRENDYDYPEFIPSQQQAYASAGSSPTSGFSPYCSTDSNTNISDFYETGFGEIQSTNFSGELGASKTYWESVDYNDYDMAYGRHSNLGGIKESCPSGEYFPDALTLNTIEVQNYLEPSPSQTDSNTGTGYQKPRDTHAQTWTVESKRLSNRFFPRLFHKWKELSRCRKSPESANQPVVEQCCMWNEEIWRVH